ncbi:hypothetical protein KBC75_03630 [Candidatus Shapirobacteria bacterium]|nr:hypothetical protein [Candidatus Shapirobacteria bacterium]
MKKLFFLFSFLFLNLTSYILHPSPVRAVISNPIITNGTAQVTDPQGYTNKVISSVFSIFFIVAVVYFVWHIVFAGYHFISSEGDPKRYEMAKNEITWSVLGIVVCFSIFAVLKFVGTILGITGLESLTITWPTI